VDPLGRSLRQEGAGLLDIGERNNVYERIMPGIKPYQQRTDRLYFVSYGVVAEFDRSDYAIAEDGSILQFIPPNTVFHIGLPDASDDAETQRPVLPGQIDGRIDARIDGRIDGQIDGQVDGSVKPISAEKPDVQDQQTKMSAEQSYGALITGQRALVLSALERLSEPAAHP
jgi:hypothetical protein